MSDIDRNLLVSIVVPVYNRERTLSVCLAGILSIEHRNIEVIVVDDGSSDNSLQVANRYAAQDSRVKVYAQKNAGVSAARNKGIELARGEWVTFVDSDDTLNGAVVDRVLGFCEESRYDLIIMGGEYCYFDGRCAIRLQKNSPKEETTVVESNSSVIHYIFTDYAGPLVTCWGKFFRRKMLCEQAIRFPEDVSLGEDSIFVMAYLRHVQCLLYSTLPGIIQYWMDGSWAHESLTGKLRPIPNYLHDAKAFYDAEMELYAYSNDSNVKICACNRLLYGLMSYTVYRYILLKNLRVMGYNNYSKAVQQWVRPVIEAHRSDFDQIRDRQLLADCQSLLDEPFHTFFRKIFLRENYKNLKQWVRSSVSRFVTRTIRTATNAKFVIGEIK
jgi:glycosyltransferase involved in cell wall biosynthesis